MMYLALLRGVNVGGRGVVPMASLRTTFEKHGFDDVKTYINSGNVLFRTRSTDRSKLAQRIEQSIQADLGVHARVLVLDGTRLGKIVSAIPADWVNDRQTKCDVMFLWDEVDDPDVLDLLPIDPKIDDVRYVGGAVLWRIDRADARKSRMTRIVGTALYRNMTIRNPNTVRRLDELMREMN